MRGILTAVLLLAASAPAAADFAAGVEAYHRGDHAAALRAFRPLAGRGHAGAQVSLGNMYLQGQGVPRDPGQAAAWFLKAVWQGVAQAQANLGLMYARGDGVPEDSAEAVFWLRQAAGQGHAHAQGNLGLMYAKGDGVPAAVTD